MHGTMNIKFTALRDFQLNVENDDVCIMYHVFMMNSFVIRFSLGFV